MRLKTPGRIGLALLALVLGAAAALVAFVGTIDVNGYRDVLAQKVGEATGRTLLIQGTLRLTFRSLLPVVSVERVSLANAPWGSAPWMVRAKRLEAEVALLPLLRREVRVRRLVLIEPEILLETDPKGRRNWDLFPETRDQASAPAGGALPFHVRHVRITDGRFTYRDGVAGRTTRIRVDRLSIFARSPESPLTLEARGAYERQAAEAKVTIGSLAALLRNETLPVAATVKVAGAELTADGSVTRPLDGQGLAFGVGFKAGSLADLSRLVGQPLPPIGPIRLTARVSDESRSLRLREVQSTVGTSHLAGDLALALDGRPRLSGRLTSRLLDLADFVPPSPAPAEPRFFPDASLPVETLRAFDAHFSLAADRMRAQAVGLEHVALTVTLRQGRLAVSPLGARLAGGAVTGDLALDARQTPAELTTRLEARQVEAGLLLERAGRKNILTGGKVDAVLEARGRGDTLRDLLAGLDGRALVAMGEGRIENAGVERLGADLLTEFLRILNPAARKETATELRCAVLRLDVKEGIATMDRGLAIETHKINVVGSGAVHLGSEELDIGLRPQARQGLGIGAGSLVQLVRIRGTLAAPKPELSPEGLLKVGASVGAAVATSGISLVAQALLQRITADKAPCATALGRTAQPATAQKAEPGEGGVNGFFKGILGRLERLGATDARAEPPVARRPDPLITP